MLSAKDPWIIQNSPIDAAKLHALGVISYHWNRCERALFWVFSAIVGIPENEAWALAYDLGDIAMCERIHALMQLRKMHPVNIEMVSHSLKVYDICRQNRNQLTHFHVVRKTTSNDMSLMRTSKKSTSIDPSSFSDSLSDIRRVAKELQALETQLWFTDVLFEERSPDKPMPWQPKLPLPSLLYSPPPTSPPKPRRPPRPSAASRRKEAMNKKK